MDTKQSPLWESLADALPTGVKLRFYHLSTAPSPSPALFSAAPGLTEQSTFCENHFLAVSLPPSELNTQRELLVFAIEVLIFTTATLTTIFVSKADSAGFLYLLKSTTGTPSPLRTIATTFLQSLVQARLHGPRIVLSLFARSQNQYLFPGSIENNTKHVLDDRQLIKWWCRALDPVLREYKSTDDDATTHENSSASSTAHVIVPGCDKFETRAFFPPTVKLDPPHKPRWISSYPVDMIAENVNGPPRCLVPRLPDDPKGRFLNDLDDELVGQDSQDGLWRSVKSLDQFWELMSYRQECSAGRLVGFVWLVFSPANEKGRGKNESSLAALKAGGKANSVPTPVQSQVESSSLPVLPTTNGALEPLATPASPPSSSPLLMPTDEGESVREADSAEGPDEVFYDSEKRTAVRWPEDGRGRLVIKDADYQSLMDYMLGLDFAGQEVAAKSTSSWIIKATHLAGGKEWVGEITGRRSSGTVPPAKAEDVEQKVNMLTGVRKKRKADKIADPPSGSIVTELSEMRKIAKSTAT